MNKIGNFLNWAARIFLLISFPLIGLYYLRWFQLVPSLVELSFSLVLFGAYAVVVTFFWRADRAPRKLVLFLVCLVFLRILYLDIDLHMPKIEATAKCNGITYYITYLHPLFDEQWTETHYTTWKGGFPQTSFIGYSAGPFEIVCDEVKHETHIVNTYTDVIHQTEGAKTRVYADYVGAQLESQRYFLAATSFRPQNCETQENTPCIAYNYILYECRLDYTDCNHLPIYIKGDAEFLYMETNDLATEFKLVEQHPGSEEILIFTYNENPQCHVEECYIEK